jgi:hypothetical protein
VGRLRGTLSKYYVRICDAHTVGSYEPFGVHNPLILAENPAPSLTSPHSHPLRCTSVLITVVQPAIHLDEGGSTTTPQRRHSHIPITTLMHLYTSHSLNVSHTVFLGYNFFWSYIHTFQLSSNAILSTCIKDDIRRSEGNKT